MKRILMKQRHSTIILTLVTCALTNLSAVTYYVDPNGNYSNNGTNQAMPWQTITNVNNTIFHPGDNILFRSGGTWSGQLWPKGSGDANAQIVLGSYGSGARPIIDAQGVGNSAAIRLYNLLTFISYNNHKLIF